MNPTILFDDVRRGFGGRDVLRGLSFNVRPGEVYALLGRNGAGKTTAIRVLLGFLEPDAGRAQVLGTPGARLPAAVRDRIGYVGEGHVLYPHMRVGDVLDFEHGTRLRFDRERARRDVARLGLAFDARVENLSRGARAQLALIVAVAAQPEVLVLDDPAAGLDAVVRRELLELLVDLVADEGRTVLLTSHVLTDVERIADRIGVLDGGRLVVDETIEGLKQRVQRRRVRTSGGTAPVVPGLIAARPAEGGWVLTLIDLDREREACLAAAVDALSPVEVPSLEELFLELVRPDATAREDAGRVA